MVVTTDRLQCRPRDRLSRILILLDAAQGDAEPAGVNATRCEVSRERQDRHSEKEEMCLHSATTHDQWEVHAHAAAGKRGPAVGDLPQHIGDDQTADRKVVPAQLQNNDAEPEGKRSCHQARAGPGNGQRHTNGQHHARGIGAKTEKCRVGKRGISGETANDIPRRRKRHIHRERGRHP